MPDITASIEYLSNLDLYQREKPYWCLLPPQEGFDPDQDRVDNLEFEEHHNITISDIRETKEDLSLSNCGFQVLSHERKKSSFESVENVEEYKIDTEIVLKKELDAVFVKCYELRLRKNVPFKRDQLDLNDPLLQEGPARGVHNGNIGELGIWHY